ncbi:hypothetical protein PsorP6_005983 [Peronosclerospora sorghi]|uniref:Uncharacterized protein n=1 Tax=Peronosclerospora sorghi TaxID=230839 RepID=A0ACC0W523_9STRA|nr:hypothetical protein PsorP6_005983 [Peronosclerospora sorghi]
MPLQPPQAGLFDSKEELIDYCKQHAISERFVVTQDRGCDERKVYLKCDRGGTNDGQSIRSRIASIRRQGCPFRIYGACTKRDNYRWRLVVKNAEHNHEPAENFLAHPAARRFNAAQQERFQQMNANNATCETILNDLQLLNPAVELDISDVYSARKKARRERLDRRTPIQEEYGADSQPVAYVESVWIRPHKERFVAAWTDQHLHLADMMRTKEIITLISPDKRSLVEAIDSEEDDAEFDERAHWSRRGLKKKVRVSSVNLR